MGIFDKKNESNPDLYFYTIYDSKTDSYREPTTAVNDADLVRQVVNMFADQGSKNKYFANAEDYSIFCVAHWTMKTGEMVASKPQHIANCHELRTAALRQMERDADQKINQMRKAIETQNLAQKSQGH